MKYDIRKLILTALVFVSKITFAIQPQLKQNIRFTENKGQVCDQNFVSRPDVLFISDANGLNFHLTKSSISYQIQKVHSEKEIETNGTKNKIPDQISIYRVDVKWLNTNLNSVVETGDLLDGVDNYYLQQCPEGVTGVRSYKEIMYAEIYKGIDLKWYSKNNELEYDFIVKPYANYEQIQIQIDGSQNLSINSKGDLIIKTPFGEIIEGKPKVFQENKLIKSSWQLHNNIISFKVGNYDHSKSLTIDPVIRNWGTYYGGGSSDYIYGSTIDNSTNIIVTGNSGSSNLLATVGAHQTNIIGGPISAILTKFNPFGVRQWGTYYGGAGANYGLACSSNANNDIYMVGYTTSTANISTASSHQAIAGGGEDGFLVKFNSFGQRQWATYYGSAGNDRIRGCAGDPSGNVFICGGTSSSIGTSIATLGSHQPTITSTSDGFVAKFTSAGVRAWGTYYGGTGNFENANSCVTDPAGNVYIVGETNSPTSTLIATPLSHQPNFGGGGQDGFVAKFSTLGLRQWGSYYGGSGIDAISSCIYNSSSSLLYFSGTTNSPTSTLIATVGSHQASFGGGTNDALLAAFNGAGVRQWSTYYGGILSENSPCCTSGTSSDIFLMGYTNSNNGISTPNSYQSSLVGSSDAMVVKFNSSGVRQWGTYYGGNGDDLPYTACATLDGIYFGGLTATSTGTAIASPSAHQAVFGGGVYDAFLVQLYECNNPSSPSDITPAANLTLCANNSATLSAASSGTVNWFTLPTGGTIVATGVIFVTPTLSTGTYTFYAEAQTCTISIGRTPITITVQASPSISVTSSSSLVCAGGSSTLTVGGATSYSWSTSAVTSSVVVNPTVNTTYTVTGITGSCSDTKTLSVNTTTSIAVNAIANPPSICAGENATITAAGASTYTWNTGANSISIVVSPTVAATNVYTVSGESGSCYGTATISLLVNACVGIKETDVQNSLISIYPNPSSGILSIEFFALPDAKEVKLEITNILGQVVFLTSFAGTKKEIDIKHLPNGLYYFSLKQHNTNSTVKIIKN